MRYFVLLAAMATVGYARPGFFYTQPLLAPTLGIEYAPTQIPGIHPHPEVAQNAASEALLPPEYLKSRSFYDNPAIAAALAKESWFTNKEMQVVEREAEKIPRENIYKIIKNAGFLH